MTNDEAQYDYRHIDELLHSRIRLSVVSVLARCEEAEFTYIRNAVGATDGNLTTHCRKLEEAGYLTVSKRFIQRKPATFFSLSEKGRTALIEYAKKLAEMTAIKGDAK